MGQGYSMTTLSAASATIDVPELSDLSHDKVLASARFTKSLRARSQQGFVFVKALMKPYSAFDVSLYVKQLTNERNIIAAIPNALGYQRIVETAIGGFLVRQYMFSSVYDRLSTRPFLEDIEKRWLSYQLLCAVRDCHAQNLYHGDIKSENLLVTSWNWLYLSDFSACFKPTTLPEDNPADFSFYFDTSSKRVCYVAPERFTSSASGEVVEELNWAMDMFSVGCAIAEIFLEGPIFTLSQIFKYKSGEYNPDHFHISKIDDLEVRAMILNMIDLSPEKRYSAEQHLSFYKSKIFPEYFYSFLHDYVQDLTEPAVGDARLTLDTELLSESDRKIDRVYHDYDKVSYFLGYSAATGGNDARAATHQKRQKIAATPQEPQIDNALHDGTLLLLTLVSSGIRNTSRASARLKACELLALFALRLPDEAKLDRILPYVVGLLNDKSDVVKVAAIHATTSILDSVKVVSPVNAYLFPEYLFPRFQQFLSTGQSQPSPIVRAAYASCLATLALASARMLDMVQAVRADGRLSTFSNDIWAPESSFHGLYDIARAEIIPHFEEATTLLITDSDTSVRRALLGSISRLCLFFESAKASDVILSHLNTYLNEPDWMLKCAFYDALVGVATYVGTSSLEQFVLPIMIGSMADAEHFVVEKVIRALSRMASLGLFQRSILWEMAGLITRYLSHPTIWIREAAAQFVEQACKFLSIADRYCIMLPILQPFLKAPLLDFGEASILDKLKPPLSRAVFEAALTWATKRDRSLFWTAAAQDQSFMIARSDASFAATNFAKRFPTRIPPSHRDRGDLQSLETLRNFGFTADDEVKLMALREYILKFSQHKTEIAADENQRKLSDIISLGQLDVTPQNVFFDTAQPYRPVKKQKSMRNMTQREQSRTVADALLDASINEDASSARSRGNVSGPKIPSQAIPVQNKQVELMQDERLPASIKSSSARRPTLRVDGADDEPGKPSNSVNGKHGLLDADRLSADRRGSKQLGHRHSTFNLLGRAETMKADAEIATTPENAFGKLDRSPSDRFGNRDSSLTQSLNTAEKSRSRSPMSQHSTGVAFEANHNYMGDEPAVVKLLDNHLYDTFPLDLYDFGPSRSAVSTEIPIKSANTSSTSTSQNAIQGSIGNKQAWRPSGLLLSQFVEHTAAVNCVVPAPDHTFFVTASDDGTCKVWDTIRLEKNVSARSRFTHRHAPGAKVKALCFVQDSHTFISAASDGSVQAVRIDITTAESGEAIKFGKPVLVRDWQIPEEAETPVQTTEHVSCMHHYREHSSSSVLLIITNLCRILMVDMKNMDVIRTMQNPLHHGVPTTLCLDRKHHWMMLGTTHGVLDLWDLRFKLRLRSFGIGGAGSGSRVDKLLLHPSRGHGKWVIVSCGGEISIWDIEKLACREVLRPSTFTHSASTKVKNYDPWLPDDENSEDVLKRFAADVQTDNAILEQQVKSDTGNTPEAGATSKVHAHSITSLCVFSDYLVNSAQPENPNKTTLMLSVGNDRTLRYWDLAHLDQSCIVSGPMINIVGEENKSKPRYETSWPTSMSLSGLVQLVEEKLSEAATDEPSSARSTPRKKREGSVRSAATIGKQSGDAAKSGKLPRNAIVSAAQEQLLKTHMDGITDVCLLRKPYGCIVSVDRGGSIFVFH